MSTDLQRPLVVDMDGTLVKTDMLFESLLRVVKIKPWLVFYIPVWLIQGREVLKRELANHALIDIGVLPFNGDVVSFLREEKSRGRRIVLATASSSDIANRVAREVGVFDDVLASQEGVNLKGRVKANALIGHFGEKGFDYIGNDQADVPVWKLSHTAHVVHSRERFANYARSLGVASGQWFMMQSLSPMVFLRALRVHQWVKNILVFIPLVMAHRFDESQLLLKAVLAFAAFCLCASSVYLLNDMVDVDDDRHHRSKKDRPIAAGNFPISGALVLFPMLLLAGFAVAFFAVSESFMKLLAVYYLLTLAYSFSLKRMLMIDVIVLAGLYTSRIVAGALAVDTELSFWLIAFSVFIFLSLALVKRYAELLVLQGSGADAIKGRGYSVEDLPALLSLGTASAYLSVLVMALYIDTQKVAELYSNPQILWLLCPVVLFWVSRVWMLTHRGQMHDDPIVFAMKDAVSRYTALCMALILFMAS